MCECPKAVDNRNPREHSQAITSTLHVKAKVKIIDHKMEKIKAKVFLDTCGKPRKVQYKVYCDIKMCMHAVL